MKSILENLVNFCKSNKTLNTTIIQSYKLYKTIYNSETTQYEFEKGLEALNKSVIKKLKTKCITFIKQECPNSYEAFISRYELISREFWDEITTQATSVDVPNTHKTRMPANWGTMSFPEKIKFTENIKDDKEFRAYVMAKDPTIKEYLKNKEYFSTVRTSNTRSDLTEQVIDKAPEIAAKKMSKDYYKSKMPLDWLEMSFSDRVAFVKAISDGYFKAYALTQDPKIKEYLKQLKHKKNKDGAFNLYVTLFSFASNKKSSETKDTLKDFVSTLNKLGRGRLQYIEIINPPTVEIRELK